MIAVRGKEHRVGGSARASPPAGVSAGRGAGGEPRAQPVAQQHAGHGAAAHTGLGLGGGAHLGDAAPAAQPHPAAHGAQAAGAAAAQRALRALGALGRLEPRPAGAREAGPAGAAGARRVGRRAQGAQVRRAGPPLPRARQQGALPLLLEFMVFQRFRLVERTLTNRAPSAKPKTHRVTVHLSDSLINCSVTVLVLMFGFGCQAAGWPAERARRRPRLVHMPLCRS